MKAPSCAVPLPLMPRGTLERVEAAVNRLWRVPQAPDVRNEPMAYRHLLQPAMGGGVRGGIATSGFDVDDAYQGVGYTVEAMGACASVEVWRRAVSYGLAPS